MTSKEEANLARSQEVIEVVFKKDRFYVRLDTGRGTKRLMPRHIYVWLRHNPSFEFIPKGYLIHHLDLDKTNDDPSNLVLMQKYHHMSYHFKQITITPKIVIDGNVHDGIDVIPTRPPTIQYHAPARRFYLSCMEKDEDGKSQRKRIWRDNGNPLFTREEAETLKRKICDANGLEQVQSKKNENSEKCNIANLQQQIL